jgi:hypothetical protein
MRFSRWLASDLKFKNVLSVQGKSALAENDFSVRHEELLSEDEYQFAPSVERFRNACNDESFAECSVTSFLPVSVLPQNHV